MNYRLKLEVDRGSRERARESIREFSVRLFLLNPWNLTNMIA